jgi:hypothetical protein
MSSGCCRNATCTFLISKCSVGVLTSVVGQVDGSCSSHCGPFQHNVEFKELWVHLLLTFDRQDWIEMAHVSRLLKLFLLV